MLTGWVSGIFACLIAAASTLQVHAETADYAPIAPKAIKSTLIDIERAGGRLVAVGERGHVLYSDDQGLSWKQGKMPFRRMLTGVDFVDSQRGWAVGHQSMIFHSEDAGETWQRQVDGFSFQQRFNEENLVRMKKAYEALAAELEANPDPSRDLELEDALFAFEDAEYALEEPAIPTNFHDVWFLDKSRGWAVGAFGRLVETRDGGKSWSDSSHRVYTPDGFHLNSITGTPHGEIYIAGESGVLFRSLDSGDSWEQIDVGYYGTFFGVTFDPVNSALTVFGLGSALYQSRDQGLTWEALESPTPATFAGGTVTAEGDTILVGPGGTVMIIEGTSGSIRSYPQANRGNFSTATAMGDGHLVLVGQKGPQQVQLK